MKLTEKEKNIVEYLRNPILRVMRKDIQMRTEPLSTLGNNEVLELYNKMDGYIEEEGIFRVSLGIYDEMYVVELLTVKEKLKTEYDKRMNSENVVKFVAFEGQASALENVAQGKDFICDVCGQHFLGFANRYIDHMRSEHNISASKLDENGEEYNRLKTNL